MARFQILSHVGGGIRGAFSTSYLNDHLRIRLPTASSFKRSILIFVRNLVILTLDDVSALLAWAEEDIGNREPEVLDKLSGIRDSIKQFQAERTSNFERCCESILEAMPDSAREEFERVFGRCYDLNAETIDLYRSPKK